MFDGRLAGCRCRFHASETKHEFHSVFFDIAVRHVTDANGQGRITATAVLPYRDLVHGTVFLLTFEPQTFQSKHSDIN